MAPKTTLAALAKRATYGYRSTSIKFGADRHECSTIVAQFVPFMQRGARRSMGIAAVPPAGDEIGAS
jgi:hypothetical protein